MILVVTNRDDHTADWLILELVSRDAKFFRFNTEDYVAQSKVTWAPPHPAHLDVRGRVCDLSSITSVWYRRPVSPRVSSDLSAERASWAIGEAREVLEGMWRAHSDLLWVNHPDRNLSASSKPEQLGVASSAGFLVPETLITNDSGEVRDFVKARRERIICKPLRTGRFTVEGKEHLFFTSLLRQKTLESLDTLGPEPYLFQELIQKRYDVRVTVIGDEAFAARIESQQSNDGQIDWRRGEPGRLGHEVEELPGDVSRRCVDLVRRYGLHYGAIDLAVDLAGRYVFFELNPNGQWAWIEQVTGLPLRSRLADLLQRGSSNT